MNNTMATLVQSAFANQTFLRAKESMNHSYNETHHEQIVVAEEEEEEEAQKTTEKHSTIAHTHTNTHMYVECRRKITNRKNIEKYNCFVLFLFLLCMCSMCFSFCDLF